MRNLLIKITTSLIIAASTFAAANTASAYVSVNGYWKSNGTYVAPHFRTSPDSSIYNNFSTWK
tara:strand:- start:27 stop:215 length:189 start_codon:yes stop_codon:yes gene_type:complete